MSLLSLVTLEQSVPDPEVSEVPESQVFPRNDEAKIDLFMLWLHDSIAYWGERFEQMKEDFQFYNGNQWSDEDKAVLRGQNRPFLTINLIFRQVNLLVGQERGTRTDFSALPMGNLPEHALLSEDMTRLIKWVYSHQNDGDYVSSEVFQDGTIGGVGWWEAPIKYDTDPIDGEILIDKIEYDKILVDRRSKKYDCSDARFMIRLMPMDLEDLLVLYPDSRDVILGRLNASRMPTEASETGLSQMGLGDRPARVHDTHRADRYQDSPHIKSFYNDETGEIVVAEIWYQEYVNRLFLVDRSTGDVLPVEEEGRPHADSLVAEKPEIFSLVPRQVKTMKVAVLLPFTATLLADGNTPWVLADGSPDPYFPYIPYRAYWVDGENYGAVRQLKDPQREKNKRRSQMLHILNTAVKSGWKVAEGALAKGRDAKWLEDNGSRTGVVIETTQAGYQMVEELTPRNFPTFLNKIDQDAEQELKDVSGLNADALGERGGDSGTSGIAVARRQAIANQIATPIFDNFHRSKRLLGRMLIRRIQQAMTVPRILSITDSGSGEEATLEINQTIPPDSMDPITRAGIIKNNVTLGKYDVRVVESQSTPTARVSTLVQIKELQQAYAEAGAAFPIGILIEATDLPSKIKQKLRAALPQMQGGTMALPGGQEGSPPKGPDSLLRSPGAAALLTSEAAAAPSLP